MILEKIGLKNFRLHKNTCLEFNNKLNFIVGGNGQGKTTILEAIYYLCTTKNFGNNSDNEVISFNENYFDIEGEFESLVKNKIKVSYLADSGKKNIWLDNKQVYKAASIIGNFPVVTLTQSDHSLTMGSPSGRRKFIDSVIAQSSETYLKIILEYNKTLRQRSYLLNKIKETNDKSLFNQLDAWTETLVNTGSQVIKHRINFINEFNEYLCKAYKNLLDELEKPSLFYQFFEAEENEDIEKTFTEILEKMRSTEIKRGVSLVGPHRDDFIFNINKMDLKKYGSQGQHKTYQIALKFAQFFFLNDKLNKEPVFLMDDVFGELDSYRSEQTSNFLRSIGQAFITLTDFTNYKKLLNKDTDITIEVRNGIVKYV